MRILIVEDEQKIANAIKQGLEQHTYAVDAAYDADEGLAMALNEPYDLLILDRMLPGSTDGIGILQKVRETKPHTPILLLTAKDKVVDRVNGLNAGADDYLVKPFAFMELLARVRALLRRPEQATAAYIEAGGLKLDTVNYVAERAGKRIELTTKEFALLDYLMRNSGRIVTKEKIMQHVWNYDADILPNTVEVYIGYLRGKIDKPFSLPPLIHTKRGFGYRFGESG